MITEESIVDLFMVGVGPGLLLTGLFVAYSVTYSLFDKKYKSSPKATWAERRQASLRALPTLILQAIISAMESALSELALGKHPEGMQDFEHVKDVIGFNNYYREEERYARK